MVNASNQALKDMSPALHRLLVSEPDLHMAQRIRDTCLHISEMSQDPVPPIIVVIGARHVPGTLKCLKGIL